MRNTIFLNTHWKYCRGTDMAFTDCAFDDSGWQSVHVPHNPTVYTAENGAAYTGLSTYRRHFTLPEDCRGQRVVLTLDGVMQRAGVYLNGTPVLRSVNGNLPFGADVTAAVRFEGENTLVVVADSSPSESYTPGKENPDFQYFGGIHRNVYLTFTSPVYITDPLLENEEAGGGIFITAPVAEADEARVHVRTHVRNESGAAQALTLQTTLFLRGEPVAACEQTLPCGAGEAVEFDDTLRVLQPQRWHPDSPVLYTAHSVLLCDGEVADELHTPFGIRKIDWRHDGLFINGERFCAQGANLHMDIFTLGNAIPDNAAFEEVRRFKDNGFDFMRMSHYPHAQAYYDACDQYGVLVLNCMSGWQFFNDSEGFRESTFHEERLMIRTARNHPCIIAWETSLNESPYPEDWARESHGIAHAEYPADGDARMWTAGWLTEAFDLTLGASQHDIRTLAEQSKKGVVISEYGDWDYGEEHSTSRVRREGSEGALLQQAFNHIESAILSRRRPWFAADAVWCYADYAGFSGEMNYSGVVDMFRFPKYSLYFYKSQKPPQSGAFVFIANRLLADSPRDVTVFTNCERVELFADGQSLGIQAPDRLFYGPNSARLLPTESLPHPPVTFRDANNGAHELCAVGYLGEAIVARYTVKTPGDACRIRLRPEAEYPLARNGSDCRLVWVTVADENGMTASGSEYTLHFTVQNGCILGENPCRTHGARTAVWVMADEAAQGDVLLTAQTDTLPAAQCVLRTR